MKLIFVLLFSVISLHVFAQETSVAGIIFDADSKDRLSRVNVLNLNTGIAVYDNLNGVFTIDAKPGDQLVFNQQDHFIDTIKIKSYTPIAVYLKRKAIQLKQVNIFDTIQNPEKRLAAIMAENRKAYGALANRELLNVGSGGVGIGIDALYNIFSRAGRNAAHLRETIDIDYKQDVIDYRFNKTLVGKITGLKDKRLADFMQKYRPGYYMVAYATEYDFITSIKVNYRRYLRNPNAHALAPLYPQKTSANLPAKQEE